MKYSYDFDIALIVCNTIEYDVGFDLGSTIVLPDMAKVFAGRRVVG
jgi:hypothetical protein